MLTIIIGKRCLAAPTADGIILHVRPMVLRRDDKVEHLQHCENLGDVDDVEFILSGNRLKVPDNVRQAATTFLNLYHTTPDPVFDCYAFANLVADVKQHRVERSTLYWQTRRRKFFRSIGDIIFLTSGDMTLFRHAAIYIGKSLYLSVAGAGGHFEVATLSDMLKDYRAERVLHAHPW